MDNYHAIHGYDRASFDTPSTHRLPTVSASQALDDLRDDTSTVISTGLDDLDNVLLDAASLDASGSSQRGGVKRGQVTEIWGPPGTGKTALGIQLATNTLCDGEAVVWVDCFQSVYSDRVKAVVDSTRKTRVCPVPEAGQESDLSRFFHYSCLTLPHLIALVSRPTLKSIPTNCSLFVISSLSALINAALPKSHDNNAAPKLHKGPTPSAKRVQALQSIMHSLQKLAATRNCAVVILSQCATKMHSERGATLTPAVTATVWEHGVSTRLVLFRDWIWQGNTLASVFLAGLQKLDGKATLEAVESIVAFKVEPDGVTKVPYDASQSIEVTGHKRKLGQTGLEVPDSEDEENYGWGDGDEAAMPAPPPQWQGSEDILLGQDVGRSDEEYSDDSYGDGDGDGDDDDNREGMYDST
ncbi:P-loop containing nucleoside triphosphate hydrolase protein [Dactylonectria macrodidyma]|uniref:P-loop containing nucleoside triphosphate hydrolase protein n=1 Tax=Dactylonectria macrodidyma TaxID=307937 RepID=A0A9P9FN57_9HYPO|nr:P-loop containing nucleoside triphosphate hydrolase protein [Dactylonectria macrodidyma]